MRQRTGPSCLLSCTTPNATLTIGLKSQAAGKIIDCERQFVGGSRLGADFRPSTVVSHQDDANSGSGS
jgi:hypothetical protein